MSQFQATNKMFSCCSSSPRDSNSQIVRCLCIVTAPFFFFVFRRKLLSQKQHTMSKGCCVFFGPALKPWVDWICLTTATTTTTAKGTTTTTTTTRTKTRTRTKHVQNLAPWTLVTRTLVKATGSDTNRRTSELVQTSCHQL